MARPGPPTGQHLGKVLADILLKKDTDAAGIIAHIQNAAKSEYHTAFMEDGETYLADMMSGVWSHVLANPELPDEMRPLIAELAGPTAQFGFLTQLLGLLSFVLTAMFQIGQPFVQTVLNEEWRGQQSLPLSAEAAAVAVLKGWMSFGDGANEASLTGINGARFQHLVDTEGNPPPLQQGYEALRRGFMDHGRFAQLIKESRYRPEWQDIFDALTYGPPSPATAVAAAVQGHLAPGVASAIVAQNGIDPSNFQWLYDTAGRPPGVQEIIALERRGLATQADVATAIQESDIKNKYIPLIQQMSVHIPPMRSVVQMVRKGVLDAATGATYLAHLGFEANVVTALIAEATSDKTATHRDLSEGMIATAYRDQLIDNPTATAHLVALGYDGAEAAFILAIQDHARDAATLTSARNRIRTIYVGGKIDRPTAANDLATLGLPPATVNYDLSLWDLERTAVVRKPTTAQLGSAVKKGIITKADMTSRLLAEGYNQTDADLIVALY